MTLYVGETLEAALIEVLAQFRPDLELISELNKIDSDDGILPATGKIPRNWLAIRSIGIAILRAEAVIVDLTQSETISDLRNDSVIAKKAMECGFSDVDASALKASGPNGRKFTQTVAAHIYNKDYNGIRYASRLGDSCFCIAGFVAVKCAAVTDSDFIKDVLPTKDIELSDPILKIVAQILGLSL